MNLSISFLYEAFPDAGAAFSLVAKHFKRPLTAILSSHAYEDGDWIDTYQEVEEKLRDSHELMFNTHDSEVFQSFMGARKVNTITFHRDQVYKLDVIGFTLLDENLVDMDALIREAQALNFTFAMKFDFAKSMWQIEKNVTIFEGMGKDYSGRKLTIDKRYPQRSGMTIDVSENPGREIRTFGFRLMAAPEMWFGPGAWRFFGMEDILSWPTAHKLEGSFDDIVYAKLFDPHAPDYEESQILETQRRFRECSKMDQVQDHLATLLPFIPQY